MTEIGVSTIGQQVAAYRKARGLSAAELAERAGLGLTRSIVANLENGRKIDLTVRQLMAIAVVLGASPADLVFDLHHPLALFSIEAESASSPAWWARRWFGGNSSADIFFPNASASNEAHDAMVIARDLDAWSALQFEIKKRDKELTTTNEKTANSSRSELRRELKELRVQLTEIERDLRSAGVNLEEGTP